MIQENEQLAVSVIEGCTDGKSEMKGNAMHCEFLRADKCDYDNGGGETNGDG